MIKSQWMVYAKKDNFDENAKKYNITNITARVIRNRDVVGEQEIARYLYGTVDALYNPHLLKDLDQAVEILKEKIAQNQQIRIVGDYDIDGVCSTYLLYNGLRRVGAKADYVIPDRIKDGYGINEQIIRHAAAEGVDTILTCDNGIAALDQITLAKELGMTVIITDHHDIMKADGREMVPPADAVVNPKQQDCCYPYPEICGGLVAYKLVQALYESYGVPLSEWEEMIDFAAIATVGDVMKLRNENRIIVKEGLKRIAKTRSLGLRKLIEKNNLDPNQLSAYHIGFVIGPCLNAGGRLQTARLALELLLCEDEFRADQMAQELKDLNEMRKDMTAQGLEQAVEQVDQLYSQDKVLVVYLPECHESLAGIIAGRLRERYQKPAFVLTKGEETAKGSGRSIEAYHMFEALVEVKELLLKFGGHPLAAGLSLEEQNIDEFRSQLNQNAKLTEDDFIKKIWIDVPLPIEYVNEQLIRELELLEPYGQGNEKPQFAQKQLHIRSLNVFGKNRNVVKLSLVSGSGHVIDGLWFGNGDEFAGQVHQGDQLDVIYYPAVNEYNGRRTLQIVIKEYRLCGKS